MPSPWRPSFREHRERNTGTNVGTWPDRLVAAWELFEQTASPLEEEMTVGDYGCGRQELRGLLPVGWVYRPYDRIERSKGTQVCDFDAALPPESHDVIFCLGVLEYLRKPESLLRHALEHARWVVFSHFSGWNPCRAFREGWKGRIPRSRLDKLLNEGGVRVRAQLPWRRDGGIWVCEGCVTA